MIFPSEWNDLISSYKAAENEAQEAQDLISRKYLAFSENFSKDFPTKNEVENARHSLLKRIQIEHEINAYIINEIMNPLDSNLKPL